MLSNEEHGHLCDDGSDSLIGCVAIKLVFIPSNNPVLQIEVFLTRDFQTFLPQIPLCFPLVVGGTAIKSHKTNTAAISRSFFFVKRTNLMAKLFSCLRQKNSYLNIAYAIKIQ